MRKSLYRLAQKDENSTEIRAKRGLKFLRIGNKLCLF